MNDFFTHCFTPDGATTLIPQPTLIFSLRKLSVPTSKIKRETNNAVNTDEKTPIAKLDDLKGKRIRVSGAVQSDVVKAFGGVPVANIPATQIAENLSRNLLDGALVDMGNVYNFSIQDETLYHVTNLPLGSFAVLFLMNKDRYAALDDAQKKAVDAVRGEWFTKTVGADMDAQMHDIENRLRIGGEREIPSRRLGDWVMQGLKNIDHVAYIRFASVYLSFQDVEAFINTIAELRRN